MDLIYLLLVIPLVVSYRYSLVSYSGWRWIQYQWFHKQFHWFIPFYLIVQLVLVQRLLYFTYLRYFTHFTTQCVSDSVAPVESMKVFPSLYFFFSSACSCQFGPFKSVREETVQSRESRSVLRSKCEAIWQLMEAATCDTCRCFSKRRRSSSEYIPHLRVLIFILNRVARTSLWTELRFDCLISVAGAACLYLSTYSRQFYFFKLLLFCRWII